MPADEIDGNAASSAPFFRKTNEGSPPSWTSRANGSPDETWKRRPGEKPDSGKRTSRDLACDVSSPFCIESPGACTRVACDRPYRHFTDHRVSRRSVVEGCANCGSGAAGLLISPTVSLGRSCVLSGHRGANYLGSLRVGRSRGGPLRASYRLGHSCPN